MDYSIIMALAVVLVISSAAATSKNTSKPSGKSPATLEAKKNKVEQPNKKPAINQIDPSLEPLQYPLGKGEIDEKKIYVGYSGSTITNPRFIDFGELVRATPQYIKIRHGNVEPNSANYWLLIAKAGEVARREVIRYASERKITLVTDKENFLAFIKKQERFKNASDDDLAKWFDITIPIKMNILKLEQE